MNFSEIFIRRPVMTTLVMGGIFLFGIMAYRFLPVNGMHQSAEDAAAMAALLAELPRPLLMFCRSGARSTRLYALAQSV